MPLRIETSRYSNIPEADRICFLFNGNHVENELHFLFKCELYNLERARLETSLGVPLINLTDKEKFKLVFEHPFSLGKYCIPANISVRDIIANLALQASRYLIQHAIIRKLSLRGNA